jgi:protoheme ferro-lyase
VDRFQVVLFSPYSEAITLGVVQELKEHEENKSKSIHFDAIYSYYDEKAPVKHYSNSSCGSSLDLLSSEQNKCFTV